ncbi:MAG TPA: ABC transporter substrate-binding protein, partial [Actinomycetota bacterium]|nr:ABC transporter substrate-binding protein [Actinomycetota bacterium]
VSVGGSRWARHRGRGTYRLRLVALLAILALVVAGCGGGDDDGGGSGGQTGTTQAAGACTDQKLASPTDVTLILDFLPNPVHIAIYQGLAAGTYEANNINLKVQTPTSTSDTLRLLATDRADIGIVSLLDFLTSYQQNQPITAFMALEQRPLGSLLTLEKSGVASPKDLEGETVGVTGVPSDLAAVKSMVADDGGDPTKVKTVTIGFNAVQNLIAGKVKAAVGFWNAEGVQLQAQEPTKVFKLDEFGAPAYPELVAFTRNDTINDNPALVCAFTKATVEGYTSATANPDQALDNLTKQAEGLALSDAKAQYEALKPVLQADAPVYGALNLQVLADYLTWAKEAKILDLSDEPTKFATDRFTASA